MFGSSVVNNAFNDYKSCYATFLESLNLENLEELLGKLNNFKLDTKSLDNLVNGLNSRLESFGLKLDVSATSIASKTAKQKEDVDNSKKAVSKDSVDNVEIFEFNHPDVINKGDNKSEFEDKKVTSDFFDNDNETYGNIYPDNSWTKLDNVEKTVDLVHAPSGSYFHIDKAGNTVIHLTGNAKLVIDKELTLSVGDNVSVGINGIINILNQIQEMDNMKLIINSEGITHELQGSLVSTIKKDVTSTVEGKTSTEIKGDKSEKVSGKYEVNASGDTTIKSDANMTIKASKIDIN